MTTHKESFDKSLDKYIEQRPIPVVAIANYLGIKVFEKDFKDDDKYGEISKDSNNDYTITVNAKSDGLRKRHTIAHEIGHFVEHEDFFKNHNIINDVKLNFQKNGYTELELIQEDEANEFAINLLVPKELAFKMLTSGKTVQDIANIFVVSEATVNLSIGWEVGLG